MGKGEFFEIHKFMMPSQTCMVFVQAGIALGELQSLGDLYDFNSMATLFLIGIVSVTPTLVSKNKS